MSQKYYQKLWDDTQATLSKNLAFEGRIKRKAPYEDQNLAKWLIGHLFVNYVRAVNDLDRCYDQMVHPQKREVLGRLLDLALGRLLELKADIRRIEIDNYCFFDDVLVELKLTHDDVEIHVPRYFWRDKEKIKAHRKKLINKVFEEAERENFRIEYLKNIPEEGRQEAWDKYVAKEEQQRLEREKLEEQQKKMLSGRTTGMTSLDKLLRETRESETMQSEDLKALADSVLMLQRHERARRGRTRATWAKKYKRLKQQGAFARKTPENVARKAATVIQRHWRRHRRKLLRKRREEQLSELLGMAASSEKETASENRLEKVERLRRKMRERNQKELEEACDPVKAKAAAHHSLSMEESIVDEIRNWFLWFFAESNFLPDYPPEDRLIPTGNLLGIPKALDSGFVEKNFPRPPQKSEDPPPTTALGMALCGLTAIGGSALVTAGHWIGPQEYVICQKELEKMSKAGGKDGGKDSKGGKGGKGGAKDDKGDKKKKEQNLGFELGTSSFVTPLKKAERDYRVTWKDADESKNFEQRYLYDMVKDDKCWELSMEIRAVVDDMMRLELEILKDALEMDKNPGKKRKTKNPKPKKEKKKKEKKDPTGHRSIDDLFMELFRNGIIKDYAEAHIKDYIGEKSYCAHEFRRKNEDWPPSPGDVRDVLLQLCILPLGSSRVHQLAPLVKSACLLGSENSGKEFLARIVCTETAAVMFDLSAANVAGKYPGKEGLKTLEHLVGKLSRALQPSVIFVDATEKTFYKKVPKEERDADPKRMAGLISKLVKSIKGPDQVLVLGVCSQPWLANRNKFLKTYQQLIYVPQMDYSSYYRLWQALLVGRHCISRTFDVSCLAKASAGFSVKAIIDAVNNIFTIQRISTSRFYPFAPSEFLEELLKVKPIDENLADKCLIFYNGTDLPKKRAKRLQEIKDELEKAKKKG